MTKKYKIVDSQGLGLRVFNNKQLAFEFLKTRPELQMVVVDDKEDTFQDLLKRAGECKF